LSQIESKLAAWARLLRISLAPTAVADVLAGLVLAQGFLPGWNTTLLLVGASLCVYHGGMALNDWSDRVEDAKTRPNRPIPSGRISPNMALAAAAGLFSSGVLLAVLVSPAAGGWVLALALCAASYDLFGRGPWLGPLLLGACRAANMSVGFFAVDVDFMAISSLWSAPLLYGMYVFTLSRLGRMEDGEDSSRKTRTPRQLLVSLAVWFWIIAFLPVPYASLPGRGVALFLGIAASIGLLRQAKKLETWVPADVVPAMGCALRRMLVFSAAVAALPGGLNNALVVLLILSLYPVAWYLRRVSPPS
jgi:4-hydroxybenzoate polyprenyltransferase